MASFVDRAHVTFKAGDGGNGGVSFHREKFVVNGGPDGGDGGRGGDIVLVASDNLHTLLDFSYKKNYRAENGAPGSSNKRTGKSGEDLIIPVPVGTVVIDKHVNPYRDDSEFFRNKKCISLGFVIGKDYQKQGYGTEMLKFLTDYLLLQFDACFADHFSENIPSKKVIINSGYIFNETYTMYFDELHCEKTCDSYFKSK
jgi:GTPase involved in cell partitioning and DNA repair